MDTAENAYVLQNPYESLCICLHSMLQVLQNLFCPYITVFRCLFSDLPNSDHKDTNYFPMISIKTEKVIIPSLVNSFFLGSLMKICYFCKEFAKMGCTRHSSNMFGSALICTILVPKIMKTWLHVNRLKH